MNPDASHGSEFTPEDLATIVDWIDGNLSDEAALDFEMRLSADSELAQQVEAFANLDALVRRDARARERNLRTRRRWGSAVLLAVAAALVIAFLPRFLAPRAVECEVALAPSFALAEDWTQQVPELKGASAPGIAVSRGANSAPLSADEFLRRAQQAETAVVAGALASKRTDIEAGWFVVPIDLSAPASVVVLGFPQNAPGVRLFPSPDGADPAVDESHLNAGRQLLPSARAVVGRAPQTLDYRPGFLVPLGAQELVLLVGVRKAGLNAVELAELDSWIASERDLERASERLKTAGFSIQRLSVREPK